MTIVRSLKQHCWLLLPLMLIFSATSRADSEAPDVVTLIRVLSGTPYENQAALRKLNRSWQQGYVAPLAEILRLNNDRELEEQIVTLLRRKTGRNFDHNFQRWHRWVWSKPYEPVANYAVFKSWLYGNIDPKFKIYFANDRPSTIRLDEVMWGGVVQDGIPPLRQPDMLRANQANYLQDDNLVFGVEINGDARAYPKRIMGWHEMVVDVVGGVNIVGVYCTLCGSMIFYETRVDGVVHEMGTSGFLYRSNKLMYDKATQSLWNTLWGTPVIGPLVTKGIELKRGSVVTTTWRGWRSRHPDTTVLAMPKDYDVDYGEGVAYRAYNANDRLMFQVPTLDKRLKNKAEILGLVVDSDQPLAIAIDYLRNNPVHVDRLGDQEILVLTDEHGASRVYEGGLAVATWDQRDEVVDHRGLVWKVTEDALVNGDAVHRRLPAHRAFWFGWYAAYEDTRLVH